MGKTVTTYLIDGDPKESQYVFNYWLTLKS